MKNKPEPLKIAHFRFALIAPVIQGLYPDASEAAYYRRVTQDPILRPDGVSYKYSPDTLERWTGLYRKKGMDGHTGISADIVTESRAGQRQPIKAVWRQLRRSLTVYVNLMGSGTNGDNAI